MNPPERPSKREHTALQTRAVLSETTPHHHSAAERWSVGLSIGFVLLALLGAIAIWFFPASDLTKPPSAADKALVESVLADPSQIGLDTSREVSEEVERAEVGGEGESAGTPGDEVGVVLSGRVLDEQGVARSGLRVEVRVQEYTTPEPPWSDMTLVGTSQPTDASGTWSVRLVPEEVGNYSGLVVDVADGDEGTMERLLVAWNDVVERAGARASVEPERLGDLVLDGLDLTIVPTRDVGGRVVDDATEQPIGPVMLRTSMVFTGSWSASRPGPVDGTRYAWHYIGPVRVAAGGRFTVQDLPLGSLGWRFRLDREVDGVRQLGEVSVNKDTANPMGLVLRVTSKAKPAAEAPKWVVRGVVFDESGQPIEGASVRLGTDTGPPFVTGGDGRYELTRSEAFFDARVLAWADGYAYDATVVPQAEGRYEHDFTLADEAVIRGRVEWGEMEPRGAVVLMAPQSLERLGNRQAPGPEVSDVGLVGRAYAENPSGGLAGLRVPLKSDGVFRFPGLRAESYRIAVVDGQERLLSQVVEAPAEDVVLTPGRFDGPDVRFVGRVVDAVSGEPLVGADVVVMQTSTSAFGGMSAQGVASAVTDENGAFSVAGLVDGTYELDASADGFAESEIEARAYRVADSPHHFDFALYRERDLNVRVVDPDGVAVVGAGIEASTLAGQTLYVSGSTNRVETGAGGRTRLVRLPASKVRIVFQASGWQPRNELVVDLSDLAFDDVTLHLQEWPVPRDLKARPCFFSVADPDASLEASPLALTIRMENGQIVWRGSLGWEDGRYTGDEVFGRPDGGMVVLPSIPMRLEVMREGWANPVELKFTPPARLELPLE